MCVSKNNNRLFLAIVLGIFLTSGCSGHSVKYGANSEGEGMASEEEMSGGGDGKLSGGGSPRADGSIVDGGMVNGNDPYLQSGSELATVDGVPSGPGEASNYGRQFGGVDGSGPNQGGVTGFGSGSADASNPDPETWANAYLREKGSNPEFYGDPSSAGTSSNSSSYGHDYDGVPGSGPNYGSVEGFSQGSASRTDADPEAWAKANLPQGEGPSPVFVKPEMEIAKASRNNGSRVPGMPDSNGEIVEIRNAGGGFEGRVQDIYFAFDSWSISPEGAKYLEENAKWLHANPENSLTIEGHCDQRGTQDYNLVLGKKRAEAAREYLVNLGVQSHRINIVSYGKERPFCQNDNESCFQENRRNHMVVRINQS